MLLNTLLGGMILLVSIVVSINSIVLSHDMSSLDIQENRVEGAIDFRRNLSELTDQGENPSEPTSFLRVMSRTTRDRARRLEDDVDGVDEIQEYASSIGDTAGQLGAVDDTGGAEFAVLWKGMEFQ